MRAIGSSPPLYAACILNQWLFRLYINVYKFSTTLPSRHAWQFHQAPKMSKPRDLLSKILRHNQILSIKNLPPDSSGFIEAVAASKYISHLRVHRHNINLEAQYKSLTWERFLNFWDKKEISMWQALKCFCIWILCINYHHHHSVSFWMSRTFAFEETYQN